MDESSSKPPYSATVESITDEEDVQRNISANQPLYSTFETSRQYQNPSAQSIGPSDDGGSSDWDEVSSVRVSASKPAKNNASWFSNDQRNDDQSARPFVRRHAARKVGRSKTRSQIHGTRRPKTRIKDGRRATGWKPDYHHVREPYPDYHYEKEPSPTDPDGWDQVVTFEPPGYPAPRTAFSPPGPDHAMPPLPKDSAWFNTFLNDLVRADGFKLFTGNPFASIEANTWIEMFDSPPALALLRANTKDPTRVPANEHRMECERGSDQVQRLRVFDNQLKTFPGFGKGRTDEIKTATESGQRHMWTDKPTRKEEIRTESQYVVPIPEPVYQYRPEQVDSYRMYAPPTAQRTMRRLVTSVKREKHHHRRRDLDKDISDAWKSANTFLKDRGEIELTVFRSAEHSADAAGKGSTSLDCQPVSTSRAEDMRWLHITRETCSFRLLTDFVSNCPWIDPRHLPVVLSLLEGEQLRMEKESQAGQNQTLQAVTRYDGIGNLSSANDRDWSACFISSPYCSVQKDESRSVVHKQDEYAPKTLLQTLYSHVQDATTGPRDEKGVLGKSIVVPQLWCLLLGTDIMITVGQLSSSELRDSHVILNWKDSSSRLGPRTIHLMDFPGGAYNIVVEPGFTYAEFISHVRSLIASTRLKDVDFELSLDQESPLDATAWIQLMRTPDLPEAAVYLIQTPSRESDTYEQGPRRESVRQMGAVESTAMVKFQPNPTYMEVPSIRSASTATKNSGASVKDVADQMSTPRNPPGLHTPDWTGYGGIVPATAQMKNEPTGIGHDQHPTYVPGVESTESGKQDRYQRTAQNPTTGIPERELQPSPTSRFEFETLPSPPARAKTFDETILRDLDHRERPENNLESGSEYIYSRFGKGKYTSKQKGDPETLTHLKGWKSKSLTSLGAAVEYLERPRNTASKRHQSFTVSDDGTQHNDNWSESEYSFKWGEDSDSEPYISHLNMEAYHKIKRPPIRRSSTMYTIDGDKGPMSHRPPPSYAQPSLHSSDFKFSASIQDENVSRYGQTHTSWWSSSPFFCWNTTSGTPHHQDGKIIPERVKYLLDKIDSALLVDDKNYKTAFECTLEEFRTRHHCQHDCVPGVDIENRDGAHDERRKSDARPLSESDWVSLDESEGYWESQDRVSSVGSSKRTGINGEFQGDMGVPSQPAANAVSDENLPGLQDDSMAGSEMPMQQPIPPTVEMQRLSPKHEVDQLLHRCFSRSEALVALWIPNADGFLHRMTRKYWGSLDSLSRCVYFALNAGNIDDQTSWKLREYDAQMLVATEPATQEVIRVSFEECKPCSKGARYPTLAEALHHLHNSHLEGSHATTHESHEKTYAPIHDPCLTWIVACHMGEAPHRENHVSLVLEELHARLTNVYHKAQDIQLSVVSTGGVQDTERKSVPKLPRSLLDAFKHIISLQLLTAEQLIASSGHRRETGGGRALGRSSSSSATELRPELIERTVRKVEEHIDAALGDAQRRVIIKSTTTHDRGVFSVEAVGLEFVMVAILATLQDRPLDQQSKADAVTMYQQHISRLQYLATTRPKRRLYLELNALEAEVKAVQKVVRGQLDMLQDLASVLDPESFGTPIRERRAQFKVEVGFIEAQKAGLEAKSAHLDYIQLRTNDIKKQLAQIVEILEEDHGKAIRVFTLVTVIFLPLSFMTSFLGMNTIDIVNTTRDSNFFWTISIPMTVGVVGIAYIYGYYWEFIMEYATNYWTSRKLLRRQQHSTAAEPFGWSIDDGQHKLDTSYHVSTWSDGVRRRLDRTGLSGPEDSFLGVV